MTVSQTKNILYAEDDSNDVVIFRIAFRRATLPHALHFVEDGETAINWLAGVDVYADRAKHPLPDVLIVDLKMPRKNGFDVLKFVRQQNGLQTLPVVVLSSSDEPSDVKRAYELGATSYFVKSASYQEVIQYLRSLP